MKGRKVFATLLGLAVLAVGTQLGRAGTLSNSVIGMFPKDVGEFAYADLKAARRLKWFPQLKEQMLPSRFRQFEQFLSSAGIDPNTQVEELAWAVTHATPTRSEQLVGVALGQFSPASAESYFKVQKLPTAQVRGLTLFAFGSGVGPNDIFFLFFDSNTAAFGHRALLEKLIEVRFGVEESLLRDDKFFPLINEVNGSGVIWGVLDQGYTRLALQQLVPQSTQFPQADQLVQKLQALVINVEADSGVNTRFQAVCATPDDANLFAAMLQAGLLYRRYQEAQSNPDLAKLLEDVRVTPKGDRLELRFSATDEQITNLIQRNTFAVKM